MGKCAGPTGAHHYVFPPPAGPTSVGLCKYCAATQVAANWSRSSLWDRTKTDKPEVVQARARANGTARSRYGNRPGRFTRDAERRAQSGT